MKAPGSDKRERNAANAVKADGNDHPQLSSEDFDDDDFDPADFVDPEDVRIGLRG